MENHELQNFDETWTAPEIKIISLKENTLGTIGPGDDVLFLSS